MEHDGAQAGGEIDERAFKTLANSFDRETFRDLIGDCLDDLRAAMAGLEAASAAGDEALARREAHKVAGVLGQYACPRAAGIARALADAPAGAALAHVAQVVQSCRACAVELEARAH
jgi:HPt (histidine-containing phosphotransfer) domain-containing protein